MRLSAAWSKYQTAGLARTLSVWNCLLWLSSIGGSSLASPLSHTKCVKAIGVVIFKISRQHVGIAWVIARLETHEVGNGWIIYDSFLFETQGEPVMVYFRHYLRLLNIWTRMKMSKCYLGSHHLAFLFSWPCKWRKDSNFCHLESACFSVPSGSHWSGQWLSQWGLRSSSATGSQSKLKHS